MDQEEVRLEIAQDDTAQDDTIQDDTVREVAHVA
jgi:hypothetical protein